MRLAAAMAHSEEHCFQQASSKARSSSGHMRIKRTTLEYWALIAEIAGAIAIVVSVACVR
jgi:hypothetical protein